MPAMMKADQPMSTSWLAAASVAACAAGGYAVTATVVDRAGTVRAVMRADNAGPHTLAASLQKAYTSASAKNTTLAMMEGAQKNPAAANLVHIPGFLLLGGGVPVRVGNEVKLPKDSSAAVQSSGLIGEKYLAVEPGEMGDGRRERGGGRYLDLGRRAGR